jgi:hypothetical protein
MNSPFATSRLIQYVSTLLLMFKAWELVAEGESVSLVTKLLKVLYDLVWFTVSSTSKTYLHDITEVMLKVALNTIIQNKYRCRFTYWITEFNCFCRIGDHITEQERTREKKWRMSRPSELTLLFLSVMS